ncbi:MAG: glycosyltransferase family 4 protein [Phycisphaeraceae bacterium]|nr:glycosyltransferase family 4 protein [Phycisphaeraceae bacterium]
MRIALDARTIYRPTRRGIGRSLVSLYQELSRVRPDWSFVLFHRGQGAGPADWPTAGMEERLIEMPGDRFDAWEKWRLPLAAWRAGADVLHCPGNSCPGWLPVPTVVTVHDLIPMDSPELAANTERERFIQGVQTACRKARSIICPSAYTRERLRAEFGPYESNIEVIPWGAPPEPQVTESQIAQVRSRYGMDRPFALHFGALAPRKNTAKVLQAWAMLAPALRASRLLLIVGVDESARQEMRQQAEALEISASVRIEGFAAEGDVPLLLKASQMLIYPSLSEGFGLPILEAWAAGTAVLSSDRTSLPEVVGQAGWLVDPTEAKTIAAGMQRILADADLRQALVQAGQKRLTNYSWPTAAAQFARVLEDAASQHHQPRLAA